VIVIPAIDLRGGRCVRLHQGRADAETVFSDDPVAMARRWVAEGAERLHVVDLDGAFAGAPRQAALVARIVAAVRPVPVAAGGGLREVAAVEAVLEAGAAWAVVGTRALEPRFLDDLGRRFAGRVIVAVDARDGRVARQGWVEVSDLSPVELGRSLRDSAGVAALLYTDIRRDGTALGPNVTATVALARASRLPVLASGGVGSTADVAALAAVAHEGIEGVVIGRALYTGAVTLREAMRAAGAPGAAGARASRP
jgi:phosphoribosylformimino-5-aminoimidazole carboxamide ribotide isomerase